MPPRPELPKDLGPGSNEPTLAIGQGLEPEVRAPTPHPEAVLPLLEYGFCMCQDSECPSCFATYFCDHITTDCEICRANFSPLVDPEEASLEVARDRAKRAEAKATRIQPCPEEPAWKESSWEEFLVEISKSPVVEMQAEEVKLEEPLLQTPPATPGGFQRSDTSPTKFDYIGDWQYEMPSQMVKLAKEARKGELAEQPEPKVEAETSECSLGGWVGEPNTEDSNSIPPDHPRIRTRGSRKGRFCNTVSDYETYLLSPGASKKPNKGQWRAVAKAAQEQDQRSESDEADQDLMEGNRTSTTGTGHEGLDLVEDDEQPDRGDSNAGWLSSGPEMAKRGVKPQADWPPNDLHSSEEEMLELEPEDAETGDTPLGWVYTLGGPINRARRHRIRDQIAKSSYFIMAGEKKMWYAFDGRPLNSQGLPIYTEEERRHLDEGRYDKVPDLDYDAWGNPWDPLEVAASEDSEENQ